MFVLLADCDVSMENITGTAYAHRGWVVQAANKTKEQTPIHQADAHAGPGSDLCAFRAAS